MTRFVGLDPSTRCGFVALDTAGGVLQKKELQGIGKTDPKRMSTQIDEIIDHIYPDDVIVIEGFGFASQQAIQLGGIGWGLRMALFRRGMSYIEASPSQLKKFASGKGNTKKDELGVHIFKRWGFESSSNNVLDAFVLAHIALGLNSYNAELMSTAFTSFQREVLEAIESPPEKKAKGKRSL
ncbi:hypothetical protein [Paenibacillus sp. CF384]|uniref:hypothetical protein n=1 Tax=Paenibacillus sp. CF384 TaxID=1884382 RepID=UPI00089ACF79|nr:hypothetical protein [Paenibacillus sp. CF384]SDW79728.1 crossover junction endodeoxyribonuclease RuvC [Paenibacillus sp. CF384]